MRYIIKAVGSKDPYKPKSWTSKAGGEMISYKLQLTDESGTDVSGIIELSQKATSPAPQKGDELEGTIDLSGQYGPKFKKDFTPKGGGRGAPRDDSAIRAQFAIKTAVQLYGALSDKAHEAVDKDGAWEWLEAQAVKFYQMVDRVKASTTLTGPDKEASDFRQAVTDTFGEGIEDLTDREGGF